MKPLFTLIALICIGRVVNGQVKPSAPMTVANTAYEKYMNDNEAQHIKELVDFVAIPSSSL